MPGCLIDTSVIIGLERGDLSWQSLRDFDAFHLAAIVLSELWAEDGRIADHYPLQETPTEEYAQRTEWNVRDSDGSLVITTGAESRGTQLGITQAENYAKPLYTLNIQYPDRAGFFRWLKERNIAVLSIGGPRESESPGIYAAAKALLLSLFGV